MPILCGIVERSEEVPHKGKPSAFFVIRLNDGPRCIRGVGVGEHRFFGFGVVIPLVQGLRINGGQFPLLERPAFSGFTGTIAGSCISRLNSIHLQ